MLDHSLVRLLLGLLPGSARCQAPRPYPQHLRLQASAKSDRVFPTAAIFNVSVGVTARIGGAFFVAVMVDLPRLRGAKRKDKGMPTNKRESLIFTFIMCFAMVLWMSIYNVALHQGALTMGAVAQAWLGFPVAYVFAMCADWFVAAPLAKGFAFRFLVTPGKSSPLAMTLAVSSCTVVPMVIIMSLFGAVEVASQAGEFAAIPFMWISNIPTNFIMALLWNLLVAGPVSRFVFRRAFPVGTVLA